MKDQILAKWNCSLHKYTVPTPGILYVTRSYLLFDGLHSSGGIFTTKQEERIKLWMALKDIGLVEKISILLGTKMGIQLHANGVYDTGMQNENKKNQTPQPYVFLNFTGPVSSILYVINHLIKYRYDGPEYQLRKYLIQKQQNSVRLQKKPINSTKSGKKSIDESDNKSLWFNGDSDKQNDHDEDDDIMTRILRKSMMAIKSGQCTLEQLKKQQELLNICTSDLEDIEYETKVSDRLLRGMESNLGILYNAFTLFNDPKLKDQKNQLETTSKKSTYIGVMNRLEILLYMKQSRSVWKEDMNIYEIIFCPDKIQIVCHQSNEILIEIKISRILCLHFLDYCNIIIDFICKDDETNAEGKKLLNIFGKMNKKNEYSMKFFCALHQLVYQFIHTRDGSINIQQSNVHESIEIETPVNDGNYFDRSTLSDNSKLQKSSHKLDKTSHSLANHQDYTREDENYDVVKLALKHKREIRDQKMDQLLVVLENMKEIGTQMGTAAKESLETLDNISDKVSRNQHKLKKHVETIEDLL